MSQPFDLIYCLTLCITNTRDHEIQGKATKREGMADQPSAFEQIHFYTNWDCIYDLVYC